jgi:hypothetical protein
MRVINAIPLPIIAVSVPRPGERGGGLDSTKLPGSPLSDAKLEFVYCIEKDMIFCNGLILTRSLPARILGKLLHSNLYMGRSDFEHFEFKWDREIFGLRKATNFEIRLRRLMDLVSARAPYFRFQATDRGRFCFKYIGCVPCSFHINKKHGVSLPDIGAENGSV